MAALSKEAELLGAMHIGRFLIRLGMSGLASKGLKVCYFD